MPFGVTNGPATFQRMATKLICLDPNKVCVYIDDILIHNATFEDHLATLDTVLKKIV